MALAATLEGRFQAGGFTFDVSANGIADAFGVDLPAVPGLDLGRIDAIARLFGQVDVGPAGIEVEGSAALLLQAAGAVVDPTGLLAPLTAAIELATKLTGPELDRFVGALGGELPDGLGVDGLIARLRAAAPLLDDELISLVTGQLGGALGFDPLGALGRISPLLSGGLALLGQLGGLMALDHLSERVARGGALVRSMLNAPIALQLLARVEGWGDLARVLRAADPEDVDDVDVLLEPVREVAATIQELTFLLQRGFGFGEATVVHLDLQGLEASFVVAGAVVDPGALPAIGTAAQQVRGWLDPLLAFQPPPAAASVQAFLDAALAQIARLAEVVDRLDAASLAGPVAGVLDTVLGPVRGLERAAHEVNAGITSAFSAVGDALDIIDLAPVVRALNEAFAPLTEALGDLDSLLAEAQAAIDGAVQPVLAAVRAARTTITNVAGKAAAATQEVAAAITSLNLEELARELHDGLQSVADAVNAAQPGPVIDTVVAVIATAADVLGAVPRDLLPDDAKAALEAGCQELHAIDPAALKATLLGALAELRAEFDQEVLADVAAAFQEVLAFLETIDPGPFIAEVERDHVRPFLDRVKAFDPAVPLAPVVDAIEQAKAAIAGFDPAELLSPVSKAVDEVRGAIADLDPSALTAPLTDQLGPLVAEIRSTLRLDEWAGHLDSLEGIVAEALAPLDIATIVELLDGGFDGILAMFADRASDTPVLGTIVAGLLAGRGLPLAPGSFTEVTGWIAGRRGGEVVQARLQGAHADLDAALADVRLVDLAPALPRLTQGYEELLAAVASHPESSLLRVEVERELTGLAPLALLGPLVPNRARYLERLQAVTGVARGLAAGGQQEVTIVASGLHDQLAPLADVAQFARRLLASVGVDPARPLAEGAIELLGALRPGTVLAPLVAVAEKLRDDLSGLVREAVVAPAKDAAAGLSAALDVLDLSAVTEGLAGLHQQVLARIDALDPTIVLAGVLGPIDAVRQRLLALDPLGPVGPVVAELRELISTFETTAMPSTLLAPVLTAYRALVGAARGLDVSNVLAPVLAALDGIGAQLDRGMDGFAVALGHLLAACDSGGGFSVAVGVDLAGAVSL